MTGDQKTGRAVRRTAAGFALAGLAMLLAGCLLMAGKFTAALDIRKDGRFTYAYSGEIYLTALSKLAQMGRDANAVFKPDACYESPAASPPPQPGPVRVESVPRLVERPCTGAELAEQHKTWAANRTERAKSQKQEAEGMKSLLGGLDPSDPKAAEDFAARLRKQAGWNKVVYKGDGLFDVDFRMTGRLDRDFAFPTVERLPLAYAFLSVSRRQDRTVRIDAPGLAALSGGAMSSPLFASLAMAAARDGTPMAIPHPEGRFTLTTDAPILANNTEDGAKPAAGGQSLDWNAGVQPGSPPMALLQLAPAN